MRRRLFQELDLDTKVTVRETYKLGRLRHRDPAEGSADIWRDAATGMVVEEEYLRHGRLHRLDGPAAWARDPDGGIVTVENYWRNGRRHRDPKEGPAEISRDIATGIVFYEYYWMDGVNYRDPQDGPCWIHWDRTTGKVTHKGYADPADAPSPARPARRSVPARSAKTP